MTARDATLSIQTAMYGVAVADVTLMALISGVFDEVPEGQAKPYVAIGEALETPDNSHDRYGRESVATWHVWSTYQGFSEALGIANRLIEIFDHQTLSVACLLYTSDAADDLTR